MASKVVASVPAKKNLLTLAGFLPRYGVGSRVYRRTWSSPDCFWELTRVERRPPGPGASQWRGKAYGVLHWRGKSDGRERRVTGVHKAEWRYIPTAEEAATAPSLSALKPSASESAAAADSVAPEQTDQPSV